MNPSAADLPVTQLDVDRLGEVLDVNSLAELSPSVLDDLLTAAPEDER